MGKFLGFGKEEKGVRCVPTGDGTEICTVFEKAGNELVSTGDNFIMALDPNTCEVSLVGERRLTEENEHIVAKEMARVKRGCQRGIA